MLFSFLLSDGGREEQGMQLVWGRSTYRILGGKLEGIARCIWEDNCKCTVKKWDERTWTGLSWPRIGRCTGQL
jgi:hypothetical protein